MSDGALAKDPRSILNQDGAEALKAAVGNVVPLQSPTEITSGFPIIRASSMTGVVDSADFVESLLTEGGASVIYGPSNCGKSFWVLDLAVCVATGRSFRDELEVDQGAVVYVALEGETGIKNRIEALKQAGGLPEGAPLFIITSPVSLLEKQHPARLAESVRLAVQESKIPCRLVILDTLARAMAGGDENSGQDMTAAISAIDAIRAQTQAHVSVIHHCGKDEARGARGHSSLRAAVDTEIEITRPEGDRISTVRVTKQRDLPIGDPMPFSLETVELGTNRRGKSITSCVVHHEDSIMANSRPKKGRREETTAKDLLDLLPATSMADWKLRAKKQFAMSDSTFYRKRETLEKLGQIRLNDDGSWESVPG